MRFGITMPNFDEYHHPRTLAALAADAEQAGWDGFFVWDHICLEMGNTRDMADPWVALAAVACATERIRIGPMVTPVARRRPSKLARETVTLDHLSGGRLTLGVGLGFPPDAEFENFGDLGDNRVRAAILDEGLDVLAGLWSGEPFTYSGTHHRVGEAVFRPRPVQQPRIPVWVAGMWPARAPLRRAARWDGVFPMHASFRTLTPSEVSQIAAYVRSQRVTTGPFDMVIAGTTDSPTAGADVVGPYVEAGLTWWVESLDPWRGSFEECRARVLAGPPVL